MKRVKSNAKRRQSIIDSAHSGKNNGHSIDDRTLKMLLNSTNLDAIWDNEDGTYSALGFGKNLEFKSI